MFDVAARTGIWALWAACSRALVSLAGGFLLAAAITKAINPTDSLIALEAASDRLLRSGTPVLPAFWLLLTAEVSLGSLLVSGARLTWAVPLTAALLSVFTLWGIYLWASGIRAPCGCGISVSWGGGSASPAAVVTRNIALIALLLTAWRRIARDETVEGRRAAGAGRAAPPVHPRPASTTDGATP